MQHLFKLSARLFGIFALGFIVGLRRFTLVVTIHGRSMQPSLNPGDRVLVLRHWPKRWLRHNHVVLLNMPQQSTAIKRIIGLAGDQISTSLDELAPATRDQQPWAYAVDGIRHWDIPFDSCFVCGDYRQVSIDSRSWGPIPLNQIIGVVVLKLTPSAQPRLQA